MRDMQCDAHDVGLDAGSTAAPAAMQHIRWQYITTSTETLTEGFAAQRRCRSQHAAQRQSMRRGAGAAAAMLQPQLPRRHMIVVSRLLITCVSNVIWCFSPASAALGRGARRRCRPTPASLVLPVAPHRCRWPRSCRTGCGGGRRGNGHCPPSGWLAAPPWGCGRRCPAPARAGPPTCKQYEKIRQGSSAGSPEPVECGRRCSAPVRAGPPTCSIMACLQAGKNEALGAACDKSVLQVVASKLTSTWILTASMN